MQKPNQGEDRLYQFIQDHREEFEEPMPKNDIWAQIDQEIKPKHRFIQSNLKPFFRYAAAAVFLMVFGAAVWTLMNYRTVNQDPLLSVAKSYDPQYVQQITNFEQIIQTKSKELKEVGAAAPRYYQSFSNDLDELEKMYHSLKTELYNNPNKEELLIALIQNLQFQAEVLQKQVNVLKNINTQNNEKQ